MTPSELKANVENTGSVFFTRKSMKFFGDTMRNYSVYADEIIGICDNIPTKVWVLYRKKAVKYNVKGRAYFSQETFKRVHSKEVE